MVLAVAKIQGMVLVSRRFYRELCGLLIWTFITISFKTLIEVRC
jgi:hypothetical protein